MTSQININKVNYSCSNEFDCVIVLNRTIDIFVLYLIFFILGWQSSVKIIVMSLGVYFCNIHLQFLLSLNVLLLFSKDFEIDSKETEIVPIK